ncbi:helix-loop-helix DNA-binding domain-containing transcription factor [Phycomyces blakesleeanus]|uniref:Helix-loop-helix DNA-binding domain-containing transcription factor n=1 Tax=Phycomyces blakesleeanus TaxID=4837 RepID=A0ABR3BFR3_PHYBL
MDFGNFDLDNSGGTFKPNFGLENNICNNNQTIDNSDNVNHCQATQSGNSTHQQNEIGYNIPQLTPDGREDAYTSSSVLTGYNPEYAMSPLQIATQSSSAPLLPVYHTPLGRTTLNGLEDYGDEEEFFTPLVSPAMLPTYNSHTQMRVQENTVFSPLTSPALHPSSQHAFAMNSDGHFHRPSSESLLQQKLAQIEQQQQQLRSAHQQQTQGQGSNLAAYPSPRASFTHESPSIRPIPAKTQSLRRKIALSSPQINATNTIQSPHLHPVSHNQQEHIPYSASAYSPRLNPQPSKEASFIAPATPSLLMRLGGGSNLSSGITSNTPTSAVDNMPSLPAPLLEDSVKKATKRRRISEATSFSCSPRQTATDSSTLSPMGLRPQLVTASPRALKPLISPSLQPNGKRMSLIDEEAAVALLATKSNYMHLKEGKAKSLGIEFSTNIQSGIENRRTAHKAAEQKRRDTLKQSFDSLREEIAEAMVEEEKVAEEEARYQKEKEVKQMSKVVLLQHSYEYILRLKSDSRRKDNKMTRLQKEVQALRAKLGLPEKTVEEEEEEEREKIEEEERREARRKRLESLTSEDQGQTDER